MARAFDQRHEQLIVCLVLLQQRRNLTRFKCVANNWRGDEITIAGLKCLFGNLDLGRGVVLRLRRAAC